MPEFDPTAAGAPEGAPAEPAGPDWSSWGQVFQDPSAVNPHEVHQHYQWVQDLRSDDMHKPTLERALRDWGYLQEGEGLDDITTTLEQRRQAAADPFASLAAAGGGDDGDDFDDDGGLAMDPHVLRQVWQQDQQKLRDELLAEVENRQASARLELELERQMDKIVGEKNLDADDRKYLGDLVQYRIQTGQVNPASLSTLVADTFAADEARVNKLLNARMNQGGSLEPTAPAPNAGGAAPTPNAPVRSFKDIAKASMARLAQGDD